MTKPLTKGSRSGLVGWWVGSPIKLAHELTSAYVCGYVLLLALEFSVDSALLRYSALIKLAHAAQIKG